MGTALLQAIVAAGTLAPAARQIACSPQGAVPAIALRLALAEERLQLRDAVLGVREQVRLHLRGKTNGETRSTLSSTQNKRRAEAEKR